MKKNTYFISQQKSKKQSNAIYNKLVFNLNNNTDHDIDEEISKSTNIIKPIKKYIYDFHSLEWENIVINFILNNDKLPNYKHDLTINIQIEYDKILKQRRRYSRILVASYYEYDENKKLVVKYKSENNSNNDIYFYSSCNINSANDFIYANEENSFNNYSFNNYSININKLFICPKITNQQIESFTSNIVSCGLFNNYEYKDSKEDDNAADDDNIADANDACAAADEVDILNVSDYKNIFNIIKIFFNDKSYVNLFYDSKRDINKYQKIMTFLAYNKDIIIESYENNFVINKIFTELLCSFFNIRSFTTEQLINIMNLISIIVPKNYKINR
jgi:hypothetical protein